MSVPFCSSKNNPLRIIRLDRFLLFWFIAFTAVGCNTFDPKATVPSYIQVDSMPFAGKPNTGGNSQNIIDVWLYANGQKLGTYTLPTSPIPVLADGQVTVAISAGTFADGVKGNRVEYPFFNQYSENVALTRGKTTILKPVTTYADVLTPFTWLQSFDNGDTCAYNPGGSANVAPVKRVPHTPDVNKANYGEHYAICQSRSETDVLRFNPVAFINKDTVAEIKKIYKFYLELDYKSTCDIFVGLERTDGAYAYDLILKPTEKWTKIYVSLADELEKFPVGSSVRFFMQSTEAPGLGHSLSVDNLKLINF